MSLNPLNELKRRLDDTETPLAKRLCLAKNVIQSHHFPSAPKERVIAGWLEILNEQRVLKGDELKNILNWLNTCDDLSSVLKIKLIQIVSQYVQTNEIQDNEILILLSFIANDKIKTQLNSQIDEYLTITNTLLQHMINNVDCNVPDRIFNNIIKYYKDSKKKLEFIIKFLNGDNIETVLNYLKTECRNTVISVCQNILFPINKKSYFISYLQTLIRKDNLEELIAEKGDNIQSVLKIMNVLFEFPKGRNEVSIDFIKHFIDVFVTCYRSESQIIFAFYIMVANFLNLQQNYIIPAMNLATISNSDVTEKQQRVLFLNMLEILLKNEVDISVTLTDTFGDKIPKVEIKKTFISFLQAVMLNQLKLDTKPDKITIKIIKIALKLDPMLIEQKMVEILSPLMTAKKNLKVLDLYIDMLNCLLETLFKLSRGTLFINQMLPSIKLYLKLGNTDESEMQLKSLDDMNDTDKITCNDIFPSQCVEFYGKLTSELMFRQNRELLVSLQNNFKLHCLTVLEDGFISPAVIILTEVLSAILSSFLRHSKMADHTVPLPIAEDFWNDFKNFEEQCLRKFGTCILKLDYNQPTLISSFLNLCLSVAQLKLLNIKYSNIKLDLPLDDTSEVFNMSSILPCLNSEQWLNISSRIEDNEAVILMDNLLLIKGTIVELLTINIDTTPKPDMSAINKYLFKQIEKNPEIIHNEFFSKTLFNHLNMKQYKELAKMLIKIHINNTDENILQNISVRDNRFLQNSLVLEIAKNVMKCFENTESLCKGLNKTDFNIAEFAKQNNMREIFENFVLISEQDLKFNVDLLTELQNPYLEERYQLLVIFITLAIKKYCQSKKIKKPVNKILQSVYELSLLPPDLYQIFPTNYIFEFENRTMLNLLTLKKSNNELLIVKNLIESAVKRVKIDSNLVISVVEILLKNKLKNNNNIDIFMNPIFQISCIILPIIVKQKKAITASAHRSILADLQDKLQKELLESFKNIDFSQIVTGNTELSENPDNVATLNAISAYSLTLSRYCETIDGEAIKNLDCLWSGLDFFMNKAICSIKDPSSKQQHVESSIQLLNITLRYIKKLETHEIFKNKDDLFKNIWASIKSRLFLTYETDWKGNILEDITVTLKFLYEYVTTDCFFKQFLEDISTLIVMKKPSEIKSDPKTVETSHKVAKFLLIQCLKANIVGPKCVAITKLTHKNCRNLRFWIRQHFDSVASKKRKINIYSEDIIDQKCVQMDDSICNLIRINLDIISEAILAAKKISLDYKYLDSIFELQHIINYLMGLNSGHLKCEITLNAFFALFDGSVAILNSLIVSREEMLEDRWPCFMQCYRDLVTLLCEKATSQIHLERSAEEKLAEVAHSIEKLTQSITKRKRHVSRICAYAIADICALIEKAPPIRNVRQHMENSISLLIQACDSSYAMPFLKRALAGSPGQVTVANMYLNYKRYHKYVGNS